LQVLRIDLSGIGDTPAADGTAESLVYPRDGLADIDAARDFLASEMGVSRVIMAGLCSGADFAYQIATRAGKLDGVIMMNPRTFLELDLQRVEGPAAGTVASDPVSREEALRVTAGFERISEQGIDALLVVSQPDPGIDYVDRHAPEAMRAAERLARFERVDVPGTDHTFTTLSSQRRIIDLTTSKFLVRHK
jgi:dienelactone hydrolase